jgi:hypothetical protein
MKQTLCSPRICRGSSDGFLSVEVTGRSFPVKVLLSSGNEISAYSSISRMDGLEVGTYTIAKAVDAQGFFVSLLVFFFFFFD